MFTLISHHRIKYLNPYAKLFHEHYKWKIKRLIPSVDKNVEQLLLGVCIIRKICKTICQYPLMSKLWILSEAANPTGMNTSKLLTFVQWNTHLMIPLSAVEYSLKMNVPC